MKFLLAAIILLVSVSGCTHSPLPTTPAVSQGFENGREGLLLEAAGERNAEFVTQPVREGEHAMKLTLWPEDIAAQKNRVEFKWDPSGADLEWYAWSIFIPEDYADVAENTGLFQIMGQWKHTPEGTEDWVGSPDLAVQYGLKDGAPGFGIYNHLPEGGQRLLGGGHIQKGQWNDLLVHISWTDGYVEAWLNREQIVTREASTGVNTQTGTHRFKLGLYRSFGIPSVNSVVLDRVRIGNSKEEVE